jgi:hypothetical protein
MSGKRLRQQCVASPGNTVLATCFRHSADMYHGGDWTKMELVGHAFATVWDYDNGEGLFLIFLYLIADIYGKGVSVGSHSWWWISRNAKNTSRHSFCRCSRTYLSSAGSMPLAWYLLTLLLATQFASTLVRFFLCIVFLSLTADSGTTIYGIDLEFCRVNARDILRHSPVAYVKEMELRGTLFEDKPLEGTVSTVFTNFFVDHREPLAALASYKVKGKWVLGDLLDGHEFIIILPVAGSTTPPDVFL